LAITAAASLANAIYEMEQQVGLASNCRDAADRIRYEGWDYDLRSRTAARRAANMLDSSDRLRPAVVETRRGHEQLMRIMETLARAELTDGLTFAQLVHEPSCRLKADATVVAILTQVTEQTAIALGNLRRRGYFVAVILNLYESWDYAEAAGALLSEGIESHHLKDEASIPEICRNFLY
jgi:hypothetical protein